MYRRRIWSVKHARSLSAVYSVVEKMLRVVQPLIRRIGYERLDRPFVAIEKGTKGVLLESRSCGQCIVGSTGLSCPMNCPKELRNGPCGGVRSNGHCEVVPDMPCVWVLAWEGNKRMAKENYPIQRVQPAIDNRLIGHSAWLRELRLDDVDRGDHAL